MSEQVIKMSGGGLSLVNPDMVPVGRFRNYVLRHDVYIDAVSLTSFALECRYICYRKVGMSFEGLVCYANPICIKRLKKQLPQFTIEPCIDPASWQVWLTADGSFTERGELPCFTQANKSKRGAESTKRKWQEMKSDAKIKRLDEILSLLVSVKRAFKNVKSEVEALVDSDSDSDDDTVLEEELCLKKNCP